MLPVASGSVARKQSVSELGQNKGIFRKHGLTLDLFYTQGSAETLQSVISNSVDIGIGLGTHAMLCPGGGYVFSSVTSAG